MPEPNVERSIAPLEDHRRLGATAAGVFERFGRDARKMLDSRVKRADLQGGAAAGMIREGREHPVENVGCENPMGHGLGCGAGADLDAPVSEGLELERELAGEESS